MVYSLSLLIRELCVFENHIRPVYNQSITNVMAMYYHVITSIGLYANMKICKKVANF